MGGSEPLARTVDPHQAVLSLLLVTIALLATPALDATTRLLGDAQQHLDSLHQAVQEPTLLVDARQEVTAGDLVTLLVTRPPGCSWPHPPIRDATGTRLNQQTQVRNCSKKWGEKEKENE